MFAMKINLFAPNPEVNGHTEEDARRRLEMRLTYAMLRDTAFLSMTILFGASVENQQSLKLDIKIIKVNPKKSLNKAFLKQRPLRSEIELFKSNLIRLIDNVDEIEREENQKNHIRDFLT